MKHSDLYLDNDHVIVLEELKDDTGVAVTGATVTLVSLIDESGAAVSGITPPISMPHDAGGTYKGALTKDIVIAAGNLYEAVIRAVFGGLQAEWTELLIAKVRRD